MCCKNTLLNISWPVVRKNTVSWGFIVLFNLPSHSKIWSACLHLSRIQSGVFFCITSTLELKLTCQKSLKKTQIVSTYISGCRVRGTFKTSLCRDVQLKRYQTEVDVSSHSESSHTGTPGDFPAAFHFPSRGSGSVFVCDELMRSHILFPASLWFITT